MAEPPLAGAVQLTVACASPAVAVGAAGVAGAVAAGAVGAGAVPPVPDSGTLTILPLASVTRRLAVLLPVVVGLNTTPISHPLSATTVAPRQVLFDPIWN